MPSLPDLPLLAFITLDIIILLGVFFLFLVAYFFKGSDFIVRLIIAFYPATYIHGHFPYLKFESDIMSIIVYLILLFIIAHMFKYVIHGRHGHSFLNKLISGIILSVSAVFLMLVLNYNILPLDAFYNFTIPFEGIFTEKVPVGIWLILPLLGVYFVHRRS